MIATEDEFLLCVSVIVIMSELDLIPINKQKRQNF